MATNIPDREQKMLELDLDYIIEETIKGMQKAADSIGLGGEL